MTLALYFATPLLLLGLLASLIPLALHLLSSVRAQETYFPTLRFLQMSMEKTARRRRIQHWLLLIVRMVLLALLAVSVSEPISQAMGGWLSGRRYATAIILDNSLSMAAQAGAGSRFERAKTEAAALLGGDEKPALAAVMTTNGGIVSKELTAQLDSLREGVTRAAVGAGRAPIRQRLEEAIGMLQGESIPQKSIFVFSDLQQVSFEEVTQMRDLAGLNDVHLLVVNTAEPTVNNVGVTDLEIAGQPVVDEILEITATLTNSSATDRTVKVSLRIDDQETGQQVRKTLREVGSEGSTAAVRFRHRFTQSGPVTGEVRLDLADDLPADNVRRFSLTIGGRIQALVVRGTTGGPAGALDPGAMLMIALDPYGTESAPWSITPSAIESGDLSAAALAGKDVAFFCNVPSFSEVQARAVEAFVRGGGSAVFFLGPDVQPENYNDRFLQAIPAEGGLLPGRLTDPVGEIGPDAAAVRVDWVEVDHPYFKGLFENQADYLSVLVQRYYRLAGSARPGKVLARLANGDPLLLTKRFGGGQVVLCATSSSPLWSNLPITGLFLPVAARISLLSPQNLGGNETYLPGAQVTVRVRPPGRGGQALPELRKGTVLNVTLPGAEGGTPQVVTVPVQRTAEGDVALFTQTEQIGTYRWQQAVPGAGPDDKLPSGAFSVNPVGAESRLEAFSEKEFQAALRRLGFPRVYVASTVADVNAAASADAKGRNWWDLVLAGVIFLLVVEAVIANRFRRRDEMVIPAHLNPRVATA